MRPISGNVSSDDVEYKLIRDLLRNYDSRIRPSMNASEALNVTFGLALAQIIDVVSQSSFQSLLSLISYCKPWCKKIAFSML